MTVRITEDDFDIMAEHEALKSPGAGAIDFTALTNIQFTPNGSVVSVTDNTIFHTNQAMVNDLPVIYEAASGATVPIGGLTFGTTYYIVNRQPNNTFQLSATLGGSAINFTSISCESLNSNELFPTPESAENKTAFLSTSIAAACIYEF